MSQRSVAKFWDWCAAGLSSLCILHCLGLPLLAVMLPVMALDLDNHFLHVLMVLLAAPISLWVIWHEDTARVGKSFIVLALSGLALMLAAVIVPVSEAIEVVPTVSGGILLATAHIRRWLREQTTTASLRG